MEKGDTEIPLPPPPPLIPSNIRPEEVNSPKRSIVTRPGFGSNGRRISLLTNHFKVVVNAPDVIFYQYSVCSTIYLFDSWQLVTVEYKVLLLFGISIFNCFLGFRSLLFIRIKTFLFS